MNELTKLFSSVLMLAAGFAAASLFGPPEVVDRLSQFLKPVPAPAADGLRPLPSDALAEMPSAWPQLAPAEPSTPLPAPPATSPFASEDSVASEGSAFAPVSWPADSAPSNSGPASADTQHNATWNAAPATDPLRNESTTAAKPSVDEWLTAATLWSNDKPPKPADESPRRLEPVKRRGRLSSGSEIVAASPQRTEPTSTADWSVDPSPATFATQPPAAAAPSLDESPYGKRHRFNGATDNAWAPATLDEAPHRLATLKPVQRQAPKPGVVQHVITDGDTLGSLAERYLGSAERASEVYELNSDRLEHPEILPIGMVLRLPDEGRARAQGGAAEPAPEAFPTFEPHSAFSTVSGPATPSFGAAPRASAQRPLQPINEAYDRPLTEAERLGPVDPLYSSEVRWDAAGGW